MTSDSTHRSVSSLLVAPQEVEGVRPRVELGAEPLATLTGCCPLQRRSASSRDCSIQCIHSPAEYPASSAQPRDSIATLLYTADSASFACRVRASRWMGVSLESPLLCPCRYCLHPSSGSLSHSTAWGRRPPRPPNRYSTCRANCPNRSSPVAGPLSCQSDRRPGCCSDQASRCCSCCGSSCCSQSAWLGKAAGSRLVLEGWRWREAERRAFE